MRCLSVVLLALLAACSPSPPEGEVSVPESTPAITATTPRYAPTLGTDQTLASSRLALDNIHAEKSALGMGRAQVLMIRCYQKAGDDVKAMAALTTLSARSDLDPETRRFVDENLAGYGQRGGKKLESAPTLARQRPEPDGNWEVKGLGPPGCTYYLNLANEGMPGFVGARFLATEHGGDRRVLVRLPLYEPWLQGVLQDHKVVLDLVRPPAKGVGTLRFRGNTLAGEIVWDDGKIHKFTAVRIPRDLEIYEPKSTAKDRK